MDTPLIVPDRSHSRCVTALIADSETSTETMTPNPTFRNVPYVSLKHVYVLLFDSADLAQVMLSLTSRFSEHISISVLTPKAN